MNKTIHMIYTLIQLTQDKKDKNHQNNIYTPLINNFNNNHTLTNNNLTHVTTWTI